MSTGTKEGRRYCIRGDQCGDKWCDRTREGGCLHEYVEANYPPQHRYAGADWPPPRRWRGSDGTIVYRTFADYCD